jgi:spermidine synthase
MGGNYKNRLFFSIAVAGISSFTTQIIVLREFLVIMYGNELVMGVILANWMLLTGVGSYLGRYAGRIKQQQGLIILLQTLMAILPVITVFFLIYLRNIVFPVGKMISAIEVFYSSLILLIPFCVVSGFLFTLFCIHAAARFRQNLTGSIYGIESIGSAVGGVLFNFIFVFYLKAFDSLLFILLLNIAAAFVLSLTNGRAWKFILIPIGLLCAGLYFWVDPGEVSRKMLYKGQDIQYEKDTPYGNLMVTRTGDQVNVYENGVTLFSTNNTIENEESVHYAMIQHPHPLKVLLVSGGMAGALNEILKYGVDSIDYVELNPWVIKTAEKFIPQPDDPRITVINQDAALFIRHTTRRYDVVLVNLPEPVTAQLNRFYTVEFFTSLKEKLNPGGIVSTGLIAVANYVSAEQKRTHSALFNTMHKVFKHVLIVPGEKDYFLASDSLLNVYIAGLIDQRGLKNRYVNRYYIDDVLLKDRSDQIMASLDPSAGVNTDFKPLAYLQQMLLWLSYFKMDVRIPLFLMIIFLVLVLIFFKPVYLGMFTGGFAASSLEFLILIAFQVIYGYVFQMTGVIIMIFMAGLALGVMMARRYLPAATPGIFVKILTGIAIYSMILPFILHLMKNKELPVFIMHFLFMVMTLVVAGLTGILFSLGSRLQSGNTGKISGQVYGSDLLGSALGIITVAVFLLPLLGLTMVCIFIGLLNLLAAALVMIRKQNIQRF